MIVSGRKVLLIVSGVLLTIGLTTFGLYFHLENFQRSTENTTSLTAISASSNRSIAFPIPTAMSQRRKY